jgi:hypothetical protein
MAHATLDSPGVTMRPLYIATIVISVMSPFTLAYGKDKPKPPLQKIYQARSTEQVYAAMVRAAGVSLTNSVKEACLVNMRWSDSSQGFYTIVNISASCQDLSDGKFSISLSPQVNTNRFRIGDFKDKNIAVFWSNVDQQLTPAVVDSAPPK